MVKSNLEGQKFGKLTFVRYEKSVNKATLALFKCDCGNEKVISTDSVKRGVTKSCGCYNILKLREGNNRRTHGLRKHPLYKKWNGIKTRCFDKNDANYCNYGAKGVVMCNEWRDDFKVFYDWCIANGWQHELQIDRINNDGNYEPNNCRFVTRKINANNKSDNHYLTVNGTKKTLAEWSEIYYVKAPTIRKRLKLGWNVENAIKTPVRQYA